MSGAERIALSGAVRALLPTLRAHHLDFGLAMDPGSVLMMVNQRRVPVMNEDSIETNLDSETVIGTVSEFTELFIRYDVPYAYNFFNRFRFGEMPLAIQPFSFYNTLVVFAPELSGRWGMALVPGTRTADGTINRTVTVLPSIIPEPVAGPGAVQNTWDVSSLTAVGVTGLSIVRGADNPHGAWEFRLETDYAALPAEYRDRYWERFVRIDRLEDADVPEVGDFVPAQIVRELAAAE